MWLLDANIPIAIAPLINSFGIQCKTAEEMGWKTLTNGELVSVAFKEGFNCILTRDNLFGESASKSIKKYNNMSLVLIRIPQVREKEYLKVFLSSWKKKPIAPIVGKSIIWP